MKHLSKIEAVSNVKKWHEAEVLCTLYWFTCRPSDITFSRGDWASLAEGATAAAPLIIFLFTYLTLQLIHLASSLPETYCPKPDS